MVHPDLGDNVEDKMVTLVAETTAVRWRGGI